MNVKGFSKYPLNADNQREPTAPSTVRWSELSVTFITLTVLKPRSSSGAGTRVGVVEPTARMHDCGGLMMAVKWEMSYMPRLEMVKVPPWYSWGWSLPSRAFFASAFASEERLAKPFAPTSLTIGVIRPTSVGTATLTSTFLYLKLKRKKNIDERCTTRRTVG